MVPTLTIHTSSGEPQVIPLKAKGMLIGRVPGCDVCLSSPEVSRHHARIFQDPFGRWILEDLDSGNGLWIDGGRIRACALAPGKRSSIGPHVLVFSQEPDAQIAPDASVVTKSTILADAGDIVLQESSAGGALSHGRMQQVDKLINRLGLAGRFQRNLHGLGLQDRSQSHGQTFAQPRFGDTFATATVTDEK